MSMFDRISISMIFKKHLDTLYNYARFKKTKKKSISRNDIVVFLLIPAIPSVLLLLGGVTITESYLSIILTCLSIFAGLLFGLLPLIFTVTKDMNKDFVTQKAAIPQNTLKPDSFTRIENQLRISIELFSNISFAISISIISIISCLLTRCKPAWIIAYLQRYNYKLFKTIWLTTTNFASYFTLILFVLTLLMILKRFFLLYRSQIDNLPEELK
jgi:hypothetical protein